MEPISSVSGVVTDLDIAPNNHQIRFGIYIRGPYDDVQDSHFLYAPMNSKIINIKARDFKKEGNLYRIHPEKRGSLDVLFRNEKYDVLLQVEVGSGFVTNEIELHLKVGDKVNQSQEIGQIKIRPNNSFAWITITSKKSIIALVETKKVVQGSKTLLVNNK
jgi:phosphatidylserine decarboxylase